MNNNNKDTEEFEMDAKYPGKCYNCGYAIDIGTRIIFNRAKKVASHKECPKADYSGGRQRSVFDEWIKRAQETEKSNG